MPFQKMMGQGTQVITVVTLCQLLNTWILHSGNLEIACLAGFVFYVAWVCIGAYFIYHAQNKIIKWYEYEKIANDFSALKKLMESYERKYQKHKRMNVINEVKLGKIKDTLEYLILRLAFINPMHLPAMTESYLRRDFHFAMYMGYCYGKVLKRFFQWSMYTTLILFGTIILTNLMFEIMADEMIYNLL